MIHRHAGLGLSIALLALLAATAACGGGSQQASDVSNGGGREPAPAVAPPTELGTTGFPGVDWEDSLADIQASYPAAQVELDALRINGDYLSRPASTLITFEGDRLASVVVTFNEEHASMDGCNLRFGPVRGHLDELLGPSSSDNLAAYWETETAAVALQCDPVPGPPAATVMPTAQLSVLYTRRQP